MVTAHGHEAGWYAPLPLWEQNGGGLTQRPAILRFDSDSFMAEMQRHLAAEPVDLSDLLLRAETWKNQAQAAAAYKNLPRWAEIQPGAQGVVPKLYQPAHGRFYLVTASLLCQIPGRPDRHIEAGAGEKVSFVLRRVPFAEQGDLTEYAWLPGKGWVEAPPLRLASLEGIQEERLPLFPMAFVQHGQRRRLFAGFIPTGSAETYAAGAAIDSPYPDLTAQFDAVLALWPDPSAGLNQAQAQSLLGALKGFLEGYLPRIWLEIQPPPEGSGQQGTGQTLSPEEEALRDVLLRQVNGQQLSVLVLNPAAFSGELDAGFYAVLTDLAAKLAAYQGSLPPKPPLPKLGEGDRYVLRCVYERPCAKNWQGDVLSQPSESFAIASFFDADAPQREARITLPFDLPKADSPKALAVMASKEMRNHLERFRSMKKLDDIEEMDEQGGSASLGMVCGLSIPMVTIVAMIAMLIIVNILDFFLHWKPLFKWCFPLKLKAGGSS